MLTKLKYTFTLNIPINTEYFERITSFDTPKCTGQINKDIKI